MSEEKNLVMALHAHQPVGNFEDVFQLITEESYRPFLEAFLEQEAGSISYHASGILLRWWQDNDPGMIDLLGELIEADRLELLTGGFYEPILPLIPERDRRVQIDLHRDYLHTLFEVEPRGLWLTERVWYPDLASDLASMGIEYLAVDDNHFRAAGWHTRDLHGHFRTEYDGDSLGIFPINKTLRYSIPFQDVPDLVDTVDRLPGKMLTMADDAEKFGSWPDTYNWVYRDGWLERFLDAAGSGSFTLTGMGEAFDNFPSRGTVYLPTASYEEMEEWALPEDRRASFVKQQDAQDNGDNDSFVRGGHFHNFLVKYPESNRLHKRMVWLSRRHRERDPESSPPRSLLSAQCNDAYWHGVFGGLYLPHLRGALWEQLGLAHRELAREELSLTKTDYDCDGREEIVIETPDQFMVIDPWGMGEVIDWHHFPSNSNLQDTLTRRWPSYLSEEAGSSLDANDNAAVDTIHHRQTRVPGEWLEAWDRDPVTRASFQPVSVEPEAEPLAFQTNEAVNWIRRPEQPRSIRLDDRNLRIHYHGVLDVVSYSLEEHGGTWQAEGFRPEGRTGVMMTLGLRSPESEWSRITAKSEGWPVSGLNRIECDTLELTDRLAGWTLTVTMPEAEYAVTYPVESISRSESGAEKIFQGLCIVMVAGTEDLSVTWNLEVDHA